MTDPILRASLEVVPEAQPLVGGPVREGAFVRIEDDARGRVGFGECAPLRGLHRESLAESIAALEDWFDGIREVGDLPPSAAFAVSCALETADGLGAAAVRDAEVAAFFAGGVDELDDDACARLKGAASVKLKIGRASPAADRALLERALEMLPQARLRLDGNRRMSFADCAELVRGIEPHRIEYLEEPLADPSDLAALARTTGLAIALDELVVDPSEEARALRAGLARARSVSAWVLRMSALGPLERVFSLADEAHRLGSDAVLSTAYESSYTLRLAVHVAAALPNAGRAHGLGTAHLLSGDACEPARVQGGALRGTALPVPFAEAWS